MKDTRENILLVSLRLFAQEGYEAVSVSQIAGELGLTKGALYRHYANKQAIFESILQKMEQLDAERAQAFELRKARCRTCRKAMRSQRLKRCALFPRRSFAIGHRTSLPRRFAGC